jgi:hypothetical protein
MSGTNPTAGPTTGGGFGGPGGGGGGGRGFPRAERSGGGFPGCAAPAGGQNGQSGQAPGGTGSGTGSGAAARPGGMEAGADGELVAYLKKHQDGVNWLLAVSGSQSAAQLIMSSGEPGHRVGAEARHGREVDGLPSRPVRRQLIPAPPANGPRPHSSRGPFHRPLPKLLTPPFPPGYLRSTARQLPCQRRDFVASDLMSTAASHVRDPERRTKFRNLGHGHPPQEDPQ